MSGLITTAPQGWTKTEMMMSGLSGTSGRSYCKGLRR